MALPPLPREFAAEFIRGGWRRVERIYGARTDLLLAWRVLAGGQRLEAARRSFMAGQMEFDRALAMVSELCRAR